MIKAKRAFFYIAMAGFLVNCAFVEMLKRGEVSPPAALGNVSYRVLHKADYNIDDSATSKAFVEIKTTEAYKAELSRYSIEVPADIDFLQSQVLASTMGTQPRGGYVIGVSEAQEFSDKVLVTVTLLSPADGCVTTQAASNPYEFIELMSAKPVEIVEVEEVLDCD